MSGIGPSSASQSGVQHALCTLGVTEAAFGLVKGLRDGLPVYLSADHESAENRSNLGACVVGDLEELLLEQRAFQTLRNRESRQQRDLTVLGPDDLRGCT